MTSFLQTYPLELHFGLYRMMSGSNYHILYLQILETERRLKLSKILKTFTSLQDFGTLSEQEHFNKVKSMCTKRVLYRLILSLTQDRN